MRRFALTFGTNDPRPLTLSVAGREITLRETSWVTEGQEYSYPIPVKDIDEIVYLGEIREDAVRIWLNSPSYRWHQMTVNGDRITFEYEHELSHEDCPIHDLIELRWDEQGKWAWSLPLEEKPVNLHLPKPSNPS